jgi:2-polyprenyl-3-methyl-5-hydroxy-6-metoxy-1,4-benzoquinol methylase
MKCRCCQHDLNLVLVDLGHLPPSNSFLTPEQLDGPEVHYPLKVWVCEHCWLGQVGEFKRAEDIFSSDYVYFSSYSASWLDHARRYVDHISERLALGAQSRVVEIASNDGYLLQYFQQRGIPCLGVEPTEGTAQACRAKGIDVVTDFFGQRLAADLVQQGGQADLILGNNVLAHVPDLHDFVGGMKALLAPHGTITLEFPHFMQLMLHKQFDTIYHEHFSYLSLHAVQHVMQAHGLCVYDVQELPTHGGSLRVFARHAAHEALPVQAAVPALLARERATGMCDAETYRRFAAEVLTIKLDLLNFLMEQKRAGRKVMAYGAAAKGNTLLGHCGIGPDLLPAVVDRSPHKVGKVLPGVHIPVLPVEAIETERPDFLLILPWNLRDEVMQQEARIREWGGRFVVAIPSLEVL